MKLKNITLAALLGMASFGASADYQCGGPAGGAGPGGAAGTVTKLLTYADGSVNIYSTWRNQYTYICNVKTTFAGSVDPLVCALWVSEIESARSSNTPIIVFYPTNGYDCTTLPTYSNSPAPTYVGF